MTDIKGAVVLVTGANGGLGTEFVTQALDLGASKVYATARNPRDWGDDRVVPLRLDVTDPASVAVAAEVASDVTVVINNAGAATGASLTDPDLTATRALFETNFFGPLEVANAFAPALAKNGGGALLNVLSVLSWLALGDTYSATKAALWSASNTQRLAWQAQGTLVTSLYLGYTDTPMTAGVGRSEERSGGRRPRRVRRSRRGGVRGAGRRPQPPGQGRAGRTGDRAVPAAGRLSVPTRGALVPTGTPRGPRCPTGVRRGGPDVPPACAERAQMSRSNPSTGPGCTALVGRHTPVGTSAPGRHTRVGHLCPVGTPG
ncbi:NAD(P)-dependent dehydrogenase (short-subunit alcohol dehydrogenase family) [Marmoricola sp. OAE513]|uniref:SDR family oxidoreductase n=1 Tax=Marmoricola sp. OAE513 TaxID=2817894 RepID=UPI003396FF91